MSIKPLGPNPLAHVIKRQQGSLNYDIRTHLYRERLKIARNLYEKDLIAHYGCVNAIEFSREGEYLVSGGDDRRVLLWHVEKAMVDKESPREMDKRHQSNIFCLRFNSNNTQILSGSNDTTVIVHDIKTGDAVDVFSHEKSVYGLSIDPLNDSIFASAGEDGRVLIFDLRAGVDEVCIAKYRAPFHAVMFHPMDSGFLITANAKEGAGLWDIRRPKTPLIRYSGESATQNCMCVRFNTLGTSIVALRRRLPPILYSTFSETPICQFYHSDYYNSCTMKSCCFAGENDEYILSGSDDFNLYAWRITDADITKTEQWVDSSQMVLYGHRSIVNQVRYNPQKCLIASSGVEKIIKLWTPFELNGWAGSLREETISYENQRNVYSHEEYLSLMNISIQNMTHDYANQNTREDPRMMAFFDTLIQQEIEAWHSSATSDSDQSTQHTSDNTSGPTSRQSSETSSSDSPNDFVREFNRNGTSTNDFKPQRTKYPNRIAYLIATKRNSLKRLAMKGAGTSGHMKSSKYGNRKTKRLNLRGIRKLGNKRNGRYSSKNKTKRHSSREPNSDSEVPTNKKVIQIKRRVNQQHLNTSSYHHHRAYRHRKIKLNHLNNTNNNNNNTNSNNINSNNGNNVNLVPTTTTTSTNSGHKRKYNAALLSSSGDDDSSDDDENDEDDIVPNKIRNNSVNSNNLNSIPSTSTGITENSKGMLFRLSQQEPDSDDDQSIQNSPTNNSNNCNGTSINNQNDSTNHNNSRNNNDIYSSHSNSRLSNSSYQEDCSSNDSLNEYFTRRKKLNSQNGILIDESPELTLNSNYLTPQTKREMYNQTPDSGIATTACSSTGSSSTNKTDASQSSAGSSSAINVPGCSSSSSSTTIIATDNHNNTNGNSLSMKLFNQKVSRVRRNYRNNFGYDTDSD